MRAASEPSSTTLSREPIRYLIVPAAIYLSLQAGAPGERGWGIPMATGIAFAVGCMALFIAGLALNGVLLKHAKIGVMVGSLLSAIAGLAILFWLGRHSPSGETTAERS
ncbi:MAG: Na+/H+ antiporter NhaA [Desulfobacterales bacterium]|jgi:Na+/H+ antiporter NhaA